jgi:hypothetical protein
MKKVFVKKCHLAGAIEKLATTFLGALYCIPELKELWQGNIFTVFHLIA